MLTKATIFGLQGLPPPPDEEVHRLIATQKKYTSNVTGAAYGTVVERQLDGAYHQRALDSEQQSKQD